MTDWLLPLRVDITNEEARYALRTWVANAQMLEDGDRLVTVGYCPPWLRPDLHIPGNHHRTGPLNVYANIRDACASGLLSDRCIVANDDMFAVESVDPHAIAWRMPLREHIGRLPAGHRVSWWASSLRLTHNLLRGKGIETPLSYELHRPLSVVTQDMARVLAESWNGHGIPPQWRSMYSNLCGIGGEQSRDGKIVSRATFPPAVPWWSSTHGTWKWAGAGIRETFTNPTRWES